MSQRKIFWTRAAALAGVLAMLATWLWIEASSTQPVRPPAEQAIAIDKSPRAQEDRKRVIDRLLADGLVRRIDAERRGTLRVSLRPGFYLMDAKTRLEHVDVIYRYHFDGASVNDTVVLRDARHGHEVGQYNPYKGGLNMYR
jgi:hypothetical protein